MRTIHVIAVACFVLAASCSAKKGKESKPEGQAILSASTPVSFHPGGKMYAYSEGGVLAIKKVGDDHVYFLTRRPPAEKKEKKKGEKKKEAKKAAKPKCTPAKAEAPLPGPQGGWHGHPAWSPDGRFIAFSARWKDANCKDDDDQDWDIWFVDVGGLTAENLDKWVKELKPKGKKSGKVKKYVLLGVESKGFTYYQATRAAGAEHFPTWATCRRLAYRTRTRVFLTELKDYAGVCTPAVEAAAGGVAASPCPFGKTDCPHAAGGKPCPCGKPDCPHAAAGKPCPCGKPDCPHPKHAGKPCPPDCPHAKTAPRATPPPGATPRPVRPVTRPTRPATRPARPAARPARPATRPAARPRPRPARPARPAAR